jgi:GABA permease
MSYVSPETVFAFLVNSYGAVAIFVYVFIAISELRLRRTIEREDPERLRVKMWGYPYLTIFTIASMLLIVAAMAFIPAQQKPLLFGVISLVALLLAYVPRYYLGRKEAPATAPAEGKSS